MAADDARAKRIRDLYRTHKAERPSEVTWGAIASAVGVSERSALEWQKTGAISHPNVVKLARYFEADADELWRGPKAPTPDLMAALPNGSSDARPSQLDRIENMLADLLARTGATPAEIAQAAAARIEALPDAAPSAPTSKRKKGRGA